MKLISFLITLIFFILMTYVSYISYDYLDTKYNVPVNKISIISNENLEWINKNKLKKIVKAYTKDNFFEMNIAKLHNEVQNLAGVSQVEVSRKWPGTILISIIPNKVFATWKETDLITQKGTIFSPSISIADNNLPDFNGELKTLPIIINHYHEFIDIIKNRLVIKNITYYNTEWIVTFENNIIINIGADNIILKLKKFLHWLPKIKKIMYEKNQIPTINLNYAQGFAIKWTVIKNITN